MTTVYRTISPVGDLISVKNHCMHMMLHLHMLSYIETTCGNVVYCYITSTDHGVICLPTDYCYGIKMIYSLMTIHVFTIGTNNYKYYENTSICLL